MQATPDEVRHMTAISTVQTIGLKRLTELNIEASHLNNEAQEPKKFSSIAGMWSDPFGVVRCGQV